MKTKSYITNERGEVMDQVSTQPLTLEDFERARKMLEETPKFHTPNFVLVGSKQAKAMRYFAMKFPKGAVIVSRIDKRKYKNKGTSKKRYFKRYRVFPIHETKYLDRDAFLMCGIYHIEFEDVPADKIIINLKGEIK